METPKLPASVDASEIKRITDLLKVPSDTRRWILARKLRSKREWLKQERKRQQPRTVNIQIEGPRPVTIVPNTTSCAKRVFKISEENPDGNKIAKGLASVFTPGIIAELTDEDKTLLKLKSQNCK